MRGRYRAVLTLVATLAGAPLPALELDASPARSYFRLGEPIVIRVLLRNPYDSKESPYVKRGFWPVPCTSPWDGDLTLSVSVTGPDGRARTATPRHRQILVRIQTAPQHFERLRPGMMYGEEIALTGDEFGFEFRERGRHTVAVGVGSAGAREWYDAWLTTNRGQDHLEFAREDLFSGSLSTTTTIDIE